MELYIKPSGAKSKKFLRTRCEHIKRVLEQHHLWLETEGKEGALADFSGWDLRGLVIKNPPEGYDIGLHCDLSHAILSQADLRNSVFVNVSAFGTDFSKADLSYCTMRRVRVNSKTSFEDSKFDESRITLSTFWGANMKRLKMRGGSIQLCDFYATDLSESILRGIELYRSSVNQVNFSRSIILGCDIDTTIAENVNFDGAKIDSTFRYSQGFKNQAAPCD